MSLSLNFRDLGTDVLQPLNWGGRHKLARINGPILMSPPQLRCSEIFAFIMDLEYAQYSAIETLALLIKALRLELTKSTGAREVFNILNS